MTRDYNPERVFVITDKESKEVLNEPACGYIVLRKKHRKGLLHKLIYLFPELTI